MQKLVHDLNIEIQQFSLWLKANKLSINIKKTFSNIPSVRHCYTQFIGVITDNKINWNEHIKYTFKNISKSVGIFSKIKNKVNKQTLFN